MENSRLTLDLTVWYQPQSCIFIAINALHHFMAVFMYCLSCFGCWWIGMLVYPNFISLEAKTERYAVVWLWVVLLYRDEPWVFEIFDFVILAATPSTSAGTSELDVGLDHVVGWTWWDWSLILRTYLPSLLWHCWLGHLTRKNSSIMCLVGCYGPTLLNPSLDHRSRARQSSMLVCIICRAATRTCCISHRYRHRKMAEFDPSWGENPWTDFGETWHGWLRPGPHPTWQLWLG